jgi:hypothetical protein
MSAKLVGTLLARLERKAFFVSGADCIEAVDVVGVLVCMRIVIVFDVGNLTNTLRRLYSGRDI